MLINYKKETFMFNPDKTVSAASIIISDDINNDLPAISPQTATPTPIRSIEGGEDGQGGRLAEALSELLTQPAAARPKEGKGGEGDISPPVPPYPPSTRPTDVDASAAQGLATDEDEPRNVVGEVYTPAPQENPVITALKDLELYQAAVSPGVHRTGCPWAQEHNQPGLYHATYSEPDATRRLGAFHCPHPHRRKLNIGTLINELGIEPAVASGKAVIRVLAGEIHRVADGAEQVLASFGDFYQHGSQIVRVRIDEETGDVRTEPLNEGSLAKALSAGARWLRWDGQKKEYAPTDPPPRHVTMLLKGQGYKYLPKLKGLARQPYLRPDGLLVTRSGYDPKAQTFGVFTPSHFPLPEPTQTAAREALTALKSLIEEFHLRADHDRSASVAAMLTAAMRSQLPVAPAFNISASTSGSGKSYLAGLFALFAGPGQPMNISYPVRAEEAGKAILTMLMTQPAVVLFDDMQTNWIPHGIINRMLTSETISDRKLGGNEAATVSTSTFVMGTGNNVEPEKDMRRRVVSIYLSPMADSPATLSYNGRPVDAVRRNRGLYVAHALTIVRAWIAAGRPMTAAPEIASYETWSDLCRQPLLWLGEPDPATSLVAQVETDPDAELLGTFLKAWNMEFGKQSAMVRTVIGKAEDDGDGDLFQSMLELPFMDSRGVNRSRFGHYLKKNANRVVGGLRIVKVDYSERNAWAVVPIGMEPSGHASPTERKGFTALVNAVPVTSGPKIDPNEIF